MPDSKLKKSGVVYLVGAGPGDPELITLRGRELIRQAEVIVYDYLASRQLLDWAREDAELIYVGKQAGCHSLPQEQINQLLVDKSRQFPVVVRLKGGDPFVFGRGGEEAEALSQAGVAFEVVPGVTAAVAAAAYAGIPVTHRDCAGELALITGHEDSDRQEDSQIDWAALGAWRGTLAFYMGVSNLPVICRHLVENGMPSDTPAAVVENGTTPRQRCIVGTVGDIAAKAKTDGLKPPAIILVGRVVRFREKLCWFERRPLYGQCIVVTRGRAQISQVAGPLRRLGAEVLECPAIRTLPPADSRPMRDAIERMDHYDGVIFTSVNGVDSFFRQLYDLGHDVRKLAPVKIGVIGPVTAAGLEKYGLRADVIPPRFIAEAIVETWETLQSLPGKRFLLVRSDSARPDLSRLLAEKGAVVDEVAAYRTVREERSPAEVIDALEKDQVDWITFSSSSTVRYFFERLDQRLLVGKKVRLASIGPITSATLRTLGLEVDVQAGEYTFDGLIRAICQAETKR